MNCPGHRFDATKCPTCDERAKVVAWLRGHATNARCLNEGPIDYPGDAFDELAERIERGEHAK